MLVAHFWMCHCEHSSEFKCASKQGCQIGRFAAKFHNLDVFQVGWPNDFWVGGLAFLAVLTIVWPKIFSVGCF